MKVELIRTEGVGLEAEILVNGQKLFVMDEFSPSDIPASPCELSNPQFGAIGFTNQSWEDMFSGNPDHDKRLKHIEGWKYEGYGEIVSVDPTIVDFGTLRLEAGPITHDQRCIGEHIMVIIDRLDLSADT